MPVGLLMQKTLLIFLAGVALAAGRVDAQPFGLGVKLGTTLNNTISAVNTLSVPSDHHFIAGPFLDVRLPLHLGLEVDALYESSLYGSVLSGGNTWQFPVLAKYKLLSGPVKPYIEGGVSFSRITDLKDIPQLNHRSNYGIVLGAGIELKLLVLRLSPEIRYNGWAFRNIDDIAGQFQSIRNQAMFLVGISF